MGISQTDYDTAVEKVLSLRQRIERLDRERDQLVLELDEANRTKWGMAVQVFGSDHVSRDVTSSYIGTTVCNVRTARNNATRSASIRALLHREAGRPFSLDDILAGLQIHADQRDSVRASVSAMIRRGELESAGRGKYCAPEPTIGEETT